MEGVVSKAFSAAMEGKPTLVSLKESLEKMLAHGELGCALAMRSFLVSRARGLSLLALRFGSTKSLPTRNQRFLLSTGDREAGRRAQRRVIEANKFISDACVLSVIGAGWQARALAAPTSTHLSQSIPPPGNERPRLHSCCAPV